MKKNNTLEEIAAFLKKEPELTLLCHARPDGDTLGCAFGLKDLLERQGKRITVLCPDSVSPRYRFLSGGELLGGTPAGKVVCLDMASPEMAGSYRALAEQADVVIDHHATNFCYGRLNHIDPEAAAAGEILVELAGLLGGLTRKAAESFYTAISTDTGCFQYGNTTARTHRIAAVLAEAGIDLAALNKHLFQTKRKEEYRLVARAMETLRYFSGDRIVTMRISLEMLAETGAGADELETISSLPAQIAGVAAAATFKETEPGKYKVSLRTDGRIHGGQVCSLFGGGGHRQAAGCFMEGEYGAVEEQMAAALAAELERQA